MAYSKKWLILLIVCAPLCLLSGCWSSVELNDRAFARTMLLDKTDNGIQLTLGFPLPNRMTSGKAGGGSDSSGPPFTYITKTGRDVGEAYRKIQSDLPRRITFGQLRHILIGKEFAQSGVKPLVDFLVREPSIHINAYLFVSEGKAMKFAIIPIIFERFPTDILTDYAKQQNTVMVTAKDILMSIYTGGDFIMPMLTFGNMGALFEKDGNHWMGTDGAAIFKEGRMVSTLTTNETRGALWLLSQLRDAEFNVTSPTDGGQVSFLVRDAKTKVRTSIHGERISFVIWCTAIADVLSSESDINVTDPGQLKRLEEVLNHKLEGRIDQAIAKSQSTQSDVFQLGNYIKWRYPGKWKSIQTNWRKQYATLVTINPQVDISIKLLGGAEKPEWNRILSGKGASK